MSAYIDLPPAMTAPLPTAVIGALSGARARFVGGCVRDALIGRPIGDVDVATTWPPRESMRRLQAAGLKVKPTGVAHGTVMAVGFGHGVEVTTLRRDVETFGRRAVVAFTDAWEVDAARRDLTINAMYCDAEGALFDFTGGVADLKAGRVRFVGAAAARVAEDYLRILRFFRFHAHYGRGAPDAEALSACRDAAAHIATLSRERVRVELMKLLAAPDPRPVADAMVEADVLRWVVPPPHELERFRAMVDLSADAAPRLAALAAMPGRELGRRLRMSNRDLDRLAALRPPLAAVTADMGPLAMRRLVWRLGNRRAADLTLMARAGAGTAADDARWRDLQAIADAWVAPEFPLRGRDVAALGVGAGPRVGAILNAVEAWWLDGDFGADHAACLEQARRLAAKADGA